MSLKCPKILICKQRRFKTLQPQLLTTHLGCLLDGCPSPKFIPHCQYLPEEHICTAMYTHIPECERQKPGSSSLLALRKPSTCSSQSPNLRMPNGDGRDLRQPVIVFQALRFHIVDWKERERKSSCQKSQKSSPVLDTGGEILTSNNNVMADHTLNREEGLKFSSLDYMSIMFSECFTPSMVGLCLQVHSPIGLAESHLYTEALQSTHPLSFQFHWVTPLLVIPFTKLQSMWSWRVFSILHR